MCRVLLHAFLMRLACEIWWCFGTLWDVLMRVGLWLVKVQVLWETEEFVCTLWDSCHEYALHSVDTYVWGWCNVTWTCSCDSRRFIRWGVGWRNAVCNLKNVCPSLGWLSFVIRVVFRLSVNACWLANLICLFFPATVFYLSVFNGDLSQWDVAKVTEMGYSKSMRSVDIDLSWRELMPLRLEDLVGSYGWGWGCDVKMLERWCWRCGRDWVHSHGPL
jgi:hypothetical protein